MRWMPGEVAAIVAAGSFEIRTMPNSAFGFGPFARFLAPAVAAKPFGQSLFFWGAKQRGCFFFFFGRIVIELLIEIFAVPDR